MNTEMNIKITGGKKLSGTVTTNPSKNGAVGLLCASMLNDNETILKNVPHIEDVHRILEVLQSIGYETVWKKNTLKIRPPKKLLLKNINTVAASKTRTAIMFMGPLIHKAKSFLLPKPGGCRLGLRSIKPHAYALEELGVRIADAKNNFHITHRSLKPTTIILFESGDTVTENTLMACAKISGKTTIKYASANYQVQELCHFLGKLGVRIDGIGTTTLVVYGKRRLNKKITYTVSEDPTDSMFFIATAILTNSSITIKRCPIEFLELELYTLKKMGLLYKMGKPYKATNGKTSLADIKILPSHLTALSEKITARPYPGLNIDNLPFFAVIATQAKGQTLIHDWVYEKRALYYTDLDKLGANSTLSDPHRIFITGPTKLSHAELVCPSALRPATILLIGMLGAKGTSILRNIYSINRGYENLVHRLNKLGAKVSIL